MAEKVSNQSVLAWFLQRISGILLAFFLITHLNVHHLFHNITAEGIINFQSVQENLMSSVWWKIYYILFVPFVAFHAMNGIWQIMADFRLSAGGTIFLKAVFWIVGLILTVVGTMTLINLF